MQLLSLTSRVWLLPVWKCPVKNTYFPQEIGNVGIRCALDEAYLKLKFCEWHKSSTF